MRQLSTRALWFVWFVLLMLFVYSAFFVMPGVVERLQQISEKKECAMPLDVNIMGISEEAAVQALECMGVEGRKFYRQVEMQEDLFYPIAYALFLGFTLFALSSFCLGNVKVTVAVTILPVVALLFDYTENYHITFLIDQFPELNSGTLLTASVANTGKWIFLFLSILAIGIFSFWSVKILTVDRM